MLKTQLHSKIFQLDPAWRGIEDLLTGDFFGALDYLPRLPFLQDFTRQVLDWNPGIPFPPLDSTDWDETRLLFWPYKDAGDENAEPDLIILSPQWLIVVEVKLDSGLGPRQLWREYRVGRDIAIEQNIPLENVYVLLLTKNRISEEEAFKDLTRQERETLRPKQMYLLWHESAAILDSWLRNGVCGRSLLYEHRRLIVDVLAALRKRRSLLFSGFAFHHMETVRTFSDRIFSPELFGGFLSEVPAVELSDRTLIGSQFDGFCKKSQRCRPSYGFWSHLQFNGFLNSAAKCIPTTTKFIKGISDEND